MRDGSFCLFFLSAFFSFGLPRHFSVRPLPGTQPLRPASSPARSADRSLYSLLTQLSFFAVPGSLPSIDHSLDIPNIFVLETCHRILPELCILDGRLFCSDHR